MRPLLAALLLPAGLFADITGTCETPFQADFPQGRELRMHIRSGDIEIAGTDSPLLKVVCEVRKHPDREKQIAIRFRPERSTPELRVYGGPTSDVRIRIEAPARTHLWIRSPAGDVKVAGFTGDKDVSIHAGDLVISVGDPLEYRYAEGSVKAGDITASPFGVTKGGLFRSFKRADLPSRYRLHAHVGAGDLVLR